MSENRALPLFTFILGLFPGNQLSFKFRPGTDVDIRYRVGLTILTVVTKSAFLYQQNISAN